MILAWGILPAWPSLHVMQSETFAEAYQDATAPFRPNILTQNPNYAEPDPEPDYTHARLAGLLNADALEDDPPNKPHKSGSNGLAMHKSFWWALHCFVWTPFCDH